MNKLLEKDIEAFDLSPWFKDMDRRNTLKEGDKAAFRPQFKQPRGSGFSIKIVQSGNAQPKVSVSTFGDVDKSKLRKEMDELGVWQPASDREVGKSDQKHGPGNPPKPQVLIKETMKTEEPKTSVARSASKVVVNIDMPGVRSPQDIEVLDLESSVEVKALAGDKAYFKILTKPPQFKLARKVFEKGILHMEFS
jgi:HSP20 family molecular chaperone IbpA